MPIKNIYHLILFTAYLLAFSFNMVGYAQTQLEKIDFKQFSTPEGLPVSMVHQVYQDRDGFIWIATFFGLFRYDGYEIETYKSNLYTPGLLPGNNVICVEEDYSHHLWIGTHEGLCRLDKQTGKVRKMPIEGISKHRINGIHVTRENRVYLGTIRGMACYDAEKDSVVLMTSQNCQGEVPKQTNIQALLEDENGDLLIGTWLDGLYYYNKKENRFTHYPPLDETNSVLTLFQDSQDNVWVGTSGAGLLKLRFSPDKKNLFVAKHFKHDERNVHSISSDYLYAIHEDLQTHSLWIGTRNGVCIMPMDCEGKFINYQESNSQHYLPVREVSSVLRDRNGLMWIGTKGAGVFKASTYAPLFQVLYPRGNGKSFTDLISTLYVERNGAFWVGFGYGIDYLHEGRKATFLPRSRPYHISYSPSKQEVLLAVHDEGVMTCREGKLLHQYKASNCKFVPHDLVYCVHEDKKGNWWLGTYYGLGVRYRDGREYRFCQLSDADPLLTKEITCLTEAPDGSLWLATNNNGVIHVTGDMDCPQSLQCESYCVENGLLPAGTPLCFLTDKNGTVWVGTEGSGLCMLDPKSGCFHSVHREYNLPGDMVGSMEEDNNGNLWLGTNQGLARLTINGEKRGETRIFTVADGLPDNFFNQNSSFYRNGTFYFGCSRGIVTFRAPSGEVHGEIPVHITDIQLDGRSVGEMPDGERSRITPYAADFTPRLTIPAAYSNFTIRFASLTYHRPQQNLYSYRLQGFDANWRFVDAFNRNAYFSQLPAGKYLFELRATNENGDWSDVRSMEIIVLPPFWATWWAYLVYALLFLLLLAYLWGMLRRKILLRNRRHLQEGETDQVHYLKLQLLTPVTSDDEKFLQEAIACVNRHLNDPNFDVTRFTNEMATSRTSLHKKLKSATGLNTTGFVRSIRLKAACRLMDANPGIRISDLAYQVGFNDPKYFSICFKKEFGMQPSEYASKISSGL